MKRLLSIAAIAAMATTAFVLVQCDIISGGAPINIKVEAATDSTVKISWSAPVEGTPDNYVVYFMETGTSTYVKGAEVAGTVLMYEHDPMGKTGKYKVASDFGGTEYEGLTTPTTEPVANAAVSVSELNAAGNSGYGWDMTDGMGMTYSMTSASNAPMVDFYISDFTTGFAGQPYSITSPDLGPTDPGNVVPAGAWKANAYTNPLTSETAPLPAHSNLTYFNYTDLATDPIVVGCYTEDGYYAMVKLSGYNTSSGTVQAQTWFQLVEGLRLIQH